MHKTFINDKPLIFENIYNASAKVRDDLLILSEAEYSLEKVLKKIDDVNSNGVIYLCARPDQAWNEFVSRFVLIEAAGGIVKNDNDELLLIFRKKRWDLPKGKLDYNESPESAAVREVIEECGLTEIEIGSFLLRTFHTYTEKNKSILKKTHWFTMNTSGKPELVPQEEEDIEVATWMNKNEITRKVFPNTYASIKEVLITYFEKE
jgi:8-oxo-dGTP pyrophosphatase MutT (NUDIX family)